MTASGSQTEFPWVGFDPSPILGDPRPRNIKALLNNDKPIWRQLYRSWLSDSSGADWVATFDWCASIFDGDEKPTGETQETYDSRLALMDSFFADFVDAVGQLKDWLRSHGEGAGRKLAIATTANHLRQQLDPTLHAYAQIAQMTRDIKERVHDIGRNLEQIDPATWPRGPKAVQVIITPYQELFLTAEGRMRAAADKVGSDREDEAALQELAEAFVAFGEGTGAVVEGLRSAAEMAWDDAVDHAKEQLKEGFQTYHKQLSDGMLTTKACLYVTAGIIGALAPTPAGPVLAPIGIALAIATPIVEKIIKVAAIKEDVKNFDVVMEHLGKRYVGPETGEPIEGAAQSGERMHMVEDTALLTAGSLVEKYGSEASKTVLEGVKMGAEPTLAVAGPIVRQVAFAVDLYNADEKELRQYLSDEQLTYLRGLVTWAYTVKDQKGYNFSEVVYHGTDEDGQYVLSVGGVTGTLSEAGRFSPQDQNMNFRVVYDRARANATVQVGGVSRQVGWPDEPEFVGMTSDYWFITKATVEYDNGYYEVPLEIGADGAARNVPEQPPEAATTDPGVQALIDEERSRMDELNPWGKSDAELTAEYGPDHNFIDEMNVNLADDRIRELIAERRGGGRDYDDNRGW